MIASNDGKNSFLNGNTKLNGVVKSFDIKQAQRQIELLGLDNEIYIRGFYHSNDPRKGDDKGRKLNSLDAHQIESWMSDQRSPYIVVNGGGHCDADVKVGRAIFYEHDNLPKELQRDLWQSIDLPEPTFQVDTGGKSIHSYWVLREPISIADWRSLQSDLLEYADADRSIKNPSRVMRLAGSCHQQGGRVEIISDSGKRYTFEELRSLIPVQEQEEPPQKGYTSTPPASHTSNKPPVPLEEFLSRSNRDAFNSGVQQGSIGRNPMGLKIIVNLLAAEECCQQARIPYTGTPEQLLLDYLNRCSPPIPQDLKTLMKQGGKYARSCFAANCDYIQHRAWWYWYEQAGSPKGKDFVKWAKQYSFPLTESKFHAEQKKAEGYEIKIEGQHIDPNSKQAYEQAVESLLHKDLSESQLDSAVQAIAQMYRRQDSQVWRLYNKKATELDKAESLESIGTELDELLNSSKATLNLDDYLPGELIKIKTEYERLCLRPEVALMQFMSTISGLLPVGSMINLCDYTNFEQALAIFFAICAEPSQRKSPGQKQIVTKPLRILQKKADDKYQAEYEEYELDKAVWEKAGGDKSGEPAPKPPHRRIYFINGATQAGLRNLLNGQKQHGLNIIYDEMAADFRNRSKKYNAGLTEDLLSYYDGFGKREALADGFAGDFDEVLLSVQGSIQPGVVAEFLNGEDDPNGYWSRISIVNQPNQVLEIPLNPHERAVRIDVTEMLAAHYEKFAELNDPVSLRLDPEAENLMIRVMNKCDRRRVEARTQGLAAQWGKLPGKIGRLAALIHLSEQLYLGSTVDNVVSVSTLQKAIKLGYFLLQEATSLYADNSPNNLAAHLKKILEEAEKADSAISARDVKMSVRVLRDTHPNTIRDYFSDLERLGHGEVIGNGTRRKFKIKTVDIVDTNVDILSTATTQSQQYIQKTVDNVDNVDNFGSEKIEGHTPHKSPTGGEGSENLKNDNNVNNDNKSAAPLLQQEPETVDIMSTNLSTVVNTSEIHTDFEGLEEGQRVVVNGGPGFTLEYLDQNTNEWFGLSDEGDLQTIRFGDQWQYS